MKTSSVRNTKKEQAKLREADQEKFTIASIWEVFSAFIVLLFLKNWIREDYLLGYSFDILIAILASYFMIRAFLVKRTIIYRYHFPKGYLALDVLTFVLCCFIKLVVETNFDITFLLLVIAYLITQRKIKQEFSKIN